MNKADLVKAVASTAGLTQTQADAAINAFAAVIVKDVLKDGNSISVPGLGTFKQKKSAAREGRNPATGASIHIAASTSIGFKLSSSLK